MNQVDCTVIENRELTPGNFLLTLRVPRPFTKPQPGQFVHLRLSRDGEPLLRRPYSLEGFFEHRGIRAVRIYYSVVGRGSRILAAQAKGRTLDLIGPLGVGFAPSPKKTAVLVAGGRGVAPLLFLSRRLTEKKKPHVFLFGARSKNELYGIREVKGGRLHLATDDGSIGYHGSVMDLLQREWLEKGHTADTAEIFTCGPHGLLHAIADFARARRIRCEASLEGPMACAVGACRGCPIPHLPECDPGRYPAMCIEGPVYDATVVDWARLP